MTGVVHPSSHPTKEHRTAQHMGAVHPLRTRTPKQAHEQQGMVNTKRFEDKVVVITGASRGIGKATALRFAKEGALVVLAARSVEPLAATKSEVESLGAKAHTVVTDVSSEADNKRMVEEAKAAFGGEIHAAFLCAGKADMGAITDTTEDQIDEIIGANVKSVMFGLKYLVPAMKAGSIVICSSSMGSTARASCAGMGLYAASKAMVDMLIKYAAVEAAPAVRVNGISPGIFSTDMTAGFNPEEMTKSTNLIPRPGNPDEIGSLVTYLASDESGYVTGSNMVIDAGWALKA
mmetsp:Transcript_13754/g.26853  ORF Transcript_13754/g.26853 Transcript_13754/m.26853 type:complete len:291 (+) Transcript_13754:6-878(+)